MPLDLFWGARSPHLWAAWFLLGWVAAARCAVVLAFVSRYRGRILASWALVLAVCVGLSYAGMLTGRSARAAELTLMVANIVGLFGVARGVERVPAPVSVLSDWTYALYLLHPFFVYAVLDILRPAVHLSPGWCVPFGWAIGLIGALTATALARLLLGEYSRDVVGA
jgi:membrane-bound acyltransferase YfiQ involved in biofilm formation